jgi:hypothetical protein
MTIVPPEPPQVTLTESARSAAADLADLAESTALIGRSDASPPALILYADRLAEEVSEVGLMLRALPGRPAGNLDSHEVQLLAALRTAHGNGEDVAAFVAAGLVRLGAELGSAYAALGNREGSWEATAAAALISGTAGPDVAAWRPW